MELYNTIRRLNPKSVFECGLAGHHLQTIRSILPTAKIGAGANLPQSDIDYYTRKALVIPDDIHVSQVDFTKPFALLRKFEFVYTDNMIGNYTAPEAEAFLKNMSNIADKFIFIIDDMPDQAYLQQFIKQALPEFKLEQVDNNSNAILLTRIEN